MQRSWPLLGAWDVAEYALDRPRLKVACYVAKIVDPKQGATSGELLACRIANTGGKPVVVSGAGGAYRSGKQVMLVSNTVALPRSLQPGELVCVPYPLPKDVDQVKYFWVTAGIAKEWKATTETVMKQVGSPKRG
jgi:hypothetical protein